MSFVGVVHWVLYIHSNFMIGDIATINEAIKALKSKRLDLQIVKGLWVSFSCKVKLIEDKKRDWLGQPHLMNVEKKFSRLVQDS